MSGKKKQQQKTKKKKKQGNQSLNMDKIHVPAPAKQFWPKIRKFPDFLGI